MISNFDLRILFWCVLSLSFLTNGQTDCVRISNCPAYSWLENSENKSGFSARDIIRQINRIHCRWEGLNRLIHCPAGSVVEGENTAQLIGSGQFAATSFVETRRISCIGSLILLVRSGRSLQFDPIILSANVGRNWFKHADLAISPSHTVAFLRSDGNCCWTMYERENKRGKIKNLQVGQDWRPTFEPRAFVKVDC